MNYSDCLRLVCSVISIIALIVSWYFYKIVRKESEEVDKVLEECGKYIEDIANGKR
jgi:membrane protein implicated in regulation of membrane protease activity